MNDTIAPIGDLFQGTPRTAGDSPTGPRSMSELRTRIHALFRRIDQEMVEHAGAQGVERTHGVEHTHRVATDPGVDRFWRGRAVQWS